MARRRVARGGMTGRGVARRGVTAGSRRHLFLDFLHFQHGITSLLLLFTDKFLINVVGGNESKVGQLPQRLPAAVVELGGFGGCPVGTAQTVDNLLGSQ